MDAVAGARLFPVERAADDGRLQRGRRAKGAARAIRSKRQRHELAAGAVLGRGRRAVHHGLLDGRSDDCRQVQMLAAGTRTPTISTVFAIICCRDSTAAFRP